MPEIPWSPPRYAAHFARVKELLAAGRVRPGTVLALGAASAALERHFVRCPACRAERDRVGPDGLVPIELACGEMRGIVETAGRIACLIVRLDGSDGPAVIPE